MIAGLERKLCEVAFEQHGNSLERLALPGLSCPESPAQLDSAEEINLAVPEISTLDGKLQVNLVLRSNDARKPVHYSIPCSCLRLLPTGGWRSGTSASGQATSFHFMPGSTPERFNQGRMRYDLRFTTGRRANATSPATSCWVTSATFTPCNTSCWNENAFPVQAVPDELPCQACPATQSLRRCANQNREFAAHAKQIRIKLKIHWK